MRNDPIISVRAGLILVATAVVLLAARPVAGQQPLYRLIELTAPDGGETRAYAINDTGQIVGWIDLGDRRHAGHWNVDVTSDLNETVHFVLQHPIFDQDYAEAFDISNGGQIVGTARTEIDCPPAFVITNAFVLRPGVLTDLGTPYPGDALTNLQTLGDVCSAHDSAAIGINNRNFVVGWADLPGGATHAFLVRPEDGYFYSDQDFDGVDDFMIDLGTLGSISDSVSAATAVNDAGEVTGYSYTMSMPEGVTDGATRAAYHAFLITPLDTDDDGEPDQWFADAGSGVNALMVDLGTLGGYNSWGRDINNAGQIVGEADTARSDTAVASTHAFLWQDGQMTDLGTLGGDFSAASGINDDGVIVGWASDADGKRRAFVYRDGQMYNLNDLVCTRTAEGLTIVPNIVLTEARDINVNGWIVGWGTVRGSDTQENRGFLLIPIDPNDCTQASAGDDSAHGTGDDPGGDGSYDGTPMIGTPGNLSSPSDDTQDTSGDDQTPSESTPTLCGLGVAAMLPLMLAGLLGARCRRRPR